MSPESKVEESILEENLETVSCGHQGENDIDFVVFERKNCAESTKKA